MIDTMASTQSSDTGGEPVERIIARIVDQHVNRPGAMLPILHGIQNELGYVPEAAVPIIAEAVNQSRAEVHGVLSFYHLYRTTPPGERILYLCRAEACQSMGAGELEAYVKEKLGIGFHETTADGRLSLEPIYCLGNCACAPAVMVDSTVHGRVDRDGLDQIIG